MVEPDEMASIDCIGNIVFFEKKMKLLNSRKGFGDPFTWALAIIVGIIFLFGAGGIIKFLLEDKTKYILLGLIILLILFKKKRNE